MSFWISFWTVFFFASLLLFAGLAVIVSIGGFFNIRSLFKSVDAQHTAQEASAEDNGT